MSNFRIVTHDSASKLIAQHVVNEPTLNEAIARAEQIIADNRISSIDIYWINPHDATSQWGIWMGDYTRDHSFRPRGKELN